MVLSVAVSTFIPLIITIAFSPTASPPANRSHFQPRPVRFGICPVRCCLARPSLDTTSVPTVGQVTEVNKDTFWPLVKGAGSKVVVLDMYTQWCGPCKVIAPKFQKLSEKYQDVVFMKLDCNQENKALAKELGIKVVPTFKILKDSKVVKEVTGAKFDDLVFAIDTVKSSS
ncbi:thioredoxin F2, chloroplastic-like [Asparagus officinalis]|uniref:thioredoxin F2, chloroplastic-like n=1 Tax=Asparagus officinalis TaxID=4686 RepID=UPI00098DE5DC|nr:thioredoxin F2, chloroplastic-like [Asparagus officinalis]